MSPGFVTIDTVPVAADIYYGNEKLGETPLNRLRLPAGCVELVARSKDPPREKKLKVIVEPNKNKSFRVEL